MMVDPIALNLSQIQPPRNQKRGQGHGRGGQRGRSLNKKKKSSPEGFAKLPIKIEGCSVCKVVTAEIGPPKYKCPKCRASYCSVVCCRQHKMVCPGIIKKVEASSSSSTTNARADGIAVEAKVITSIANSSNEYPAVDNSNKDEQQRKHKTKLENNTELYDHNNDGDDVDDDDDDDDDDDSSLEEGWKITDEMKTALRNSPWLRNELKDGGLRHMVASLVNSEKKFKKSLRRKHTHSSSNRRLPQHHHHDELNSMRQNNQNFDVFIDKLLVLGNVLERPHQQQEIITTDAGCIGSSHCLERGTDPLSATAGAAAAVNNLSRKKLNTEEELESWLNYQWLHGRPDLTLKSIVKPKLVFPKFEQVDVSSSDDDDEEEEEENDDNDDESINQTK